MKIPWLVGGDFNAILSHSEKLGGRDPNVSASISDFQGFLSDASLEDVGFKGSLYTWYNGQSGEGAIWARLDRVLVNHLWLQQFPNLSVEHLSRQASLLTPLVVKLASAGSKAPSRFCFQKMWTFHARFLSDVESCWKGVDTVLPPLHSFAIKLKAVKAMLKRWKREVFEKHFQRPLYSTSHALVS